MIGPIKLIDKPMTSTILGEARARLRLPISSTRIGDIDLASASHFSITQIKSPSSVISVSCNILRPFANVCQVSSDDWTVAFKMETKIEERTRDESDLHGQLHSDPEKLSVPESPAKRRQPFSAVWTVIACGFALMSDGPPLSQLS
jgi:hypothetical protein